MKTCNIEIGTKKLYILQTNDQEPINLNYAQIRV